MKAYWFPSHYLVYDFTDAIGQDLGYDLIGADMRLIGRNIVFAPLLFGIRVMNVALRPLEIFLWSGIPFSASRSFFTMS